MQFQNESLENCVPLQSKNRNNEVSHQERNQAEVAYLWQIQGSCSTYKITEEVAQAMGCSSGDVYGIMLSLSTVINRHLRNGDKVKLEGWGTMKLEIESDKVDNLKDFQAKKHIRGARLHFIPESQNCSPELYKDLEFEKDKSFPEK